MRILYVANSIIPSRTANSIHVMKMCHAFAGNGHDVLLAVPNAPFLEERGISDYYEFYNVKHTFSIKKLNFPKIKGKTLFFLINFFFLLIKNRPDIVYGRELFSCTIAVLLGYSTIYETHEPKNKLSGIKKILFRLLYNNKHFVRLIVISSPLKKDYQAMIRPDKIVIAPDGADPVKNNKNAISLSGPQGALNIGYTGHLYKGRGIYIIIELAIRIPSCNFHIVGGTIEDVAYWKGQPKCKGLKNIIFYGYVSPAEAERYRNSFDILIAPYEDVVSVHGNTGDTSRYMSPIKIFEYMAHGKPIVVSDLPVIREVLDNEISFLVPPDKVENWVEAINQLRDVYLRQMYGQKVLSRFCANYTWEKRADLVLKNIEI